MSLRRFLLAFTPALVSSPIRSSRPGFLAVLGVALACGVAACGLLAGPAGAAVSNVRVDLPVFSPNADGVRDSVRLSWTATPAPESLRVEIRLATQGPTTTPLRLYAFGPMPAGAAAVTWDGRDDAAVALPEGRYLLRVLELTATGGSVTNGDAAAVSVIDITPPPLPVFDDGLDLGDTTAAITFVGGIASAADSVTLYVGGVPKVTTRVLLPDSAFAAGVPLEEGPNAIAARSFDRGGNSSDLTTAITVTYRNTADVVFLRPRPFESSPNADGVLDTVYASFSLDAATTHLAVQVRAAVPFLTGDTKADSLRWVRSLYDGPAAAGTYLLPWDGRDSLGVNMPEGTWWFFVQAESSGVGGEPEPGKRWFVQMRIDRSIPAAPWPSPVPPTRTTRNTIVFKGTVTDADSVLVWRAGEVVGRAPGPAWTVTVPLTLGANPFTFEAVERSGNRSPMSATLTIDYDEPLGFHAPERFTAADVFDVNLTRTGRSVRIDLYELGGRRVRTLQSNDVAQRYELPWNVKDDRGATLGDGPYVARVTVVYFDGASETVSGAVVVAK